MTKLLTLLATSVVLCAPSAAIAKPPLPDFKKFPRKDEQRVLERVRDAPRPYRRLLRATYPQVVVRASYEYNASSVTTRKRGGEKRYIVDLDVLARKGGAFADHLTLHELGHVIANEWFDDADYERFFDLFRRSPNWRDCFKTEPGYPIPCDLDTEILADQLAFYATGNLKVRSSYDIPPLADRRSMAEAIRAGS